MTVESVVEMTQERAGRELAGRVALVTGGARGLGECICRALAGAGATVVVADVAHEQAVAVADSIEGEGGEAWAVKVDVVDDELASDMMKGLVQRYGRLDVLVNNAGTDTTIGFDELSMPEWDRILGVNLRGPILMSRLAFPIMKRQGEGHIVNIASTAAKRAWANAAAYHASKWGLMGFSHALHVEARPLGIKVTAVVSGGMRTPFLLDRFPDLDPGLLQDPMNVARTVLHVVTLPAETVIPEVMVLPMRETSWP